MIKLIRTNSENKDFLSLVKHLDMELAIRDGDDHAFYDQFNKVDHIKYVVIAYENDLAIGCGAIKEYDEMTMEVKRMYVLESHRGQGIASMILNDLESWSVSLGKKYCILETGIQQPEAIQLYTKNNYEIIPNYGQYQGVSTSICFQKSLIAETNNPSQVPLLD
jgi:putative acetyltransferase